MKLFFNFIKKYKRKIELKKVNFGRDYGWLVEYEGEVIGELINCMQIDMFWDRYDLRVVGEKNLIEVLFDEELWMKNSFQFRNKYYNKYADSAYAGFHSGDLINDKRIGMRNLYLLSV